MLAGAKLGVGERRPFGYEDGIPPEASFAPRFEWYLPLHRPRKRTNGTVCGGDRDGTDGSSRAVTLGREHLQKTLVPDAPQKPLSQRPRQPVPGLEDEPRVLDEYGGIRVVQNLAGGGGLGSGDPREVQGLQLGEVEGDAVQLYTQDLGGLPSFVWVGGYEQGFHTMESIIRTLLMLESPACAR